MLPHGRQWRHCLGSTMPSPVIFNPVITDAGEAAAFNAQETGLELVITHVAFGTGAYLPNGSETALVNEVKRVTIAAGGRITPTQIRLNAIWSSETDASPIGEIGFYAGSTLFAVWSRVQSGSVGPLGYKTPGVDFVLFNDLKFSKLPANLITVQVDPSQSSAVMAALMAHELAANAHPQYVLRAAMPTAEALLLCSTGGTANALALTTPAEVTTAAYTPGQRFTFIAAADNTGDVTVNVNTIGVKAVLTHDGQQLKPATLRTGGIYAITYDGTQFQLAGTGGGAGATGGGADEIFFLNGQLVTQDFTVPAGKNAGSFGYVDIADGVNVDIADGSEWVMV